MREFSYGIIPLRWNRQHNDWEALLIQHNAGHWAFPKGHANIGETPQETAKRELKEETGLTVVRLLSDQILEENYFFYFRKERIYKTVGYFLAEVHGDVVLQEEEVSDSRWVLLRNVIDHMTFQEGKNVCTHVQKIVSQLPFYKSE